MSTSSATTISRLINSRLCFESAVGFSNVSRMFLCALWEDDCAFVWSIWIHMWSANAYILLLFLSILTAAMVYLNYALTVLLFLLFNYTLREILSNLFPKLHFCTVPHRDPVFIQIHIFLLSKMSHCYFHVLSDLVFFHFKLLISTTIGILLYPCNKTTHFWWHSTPIFSLI